MKSKNSLYWNLCILSMIVLSVIALSPIVMPESKFTPTLFGIPRLLWSGILVYILMVIVTYIGTKVHPNSDKAEGETE